MSAPWRPIWTPCPRPPTRFAVTMANCPQKPIAAGRYSPAPKPAARHCHRGPYFTDGEIHDVGLGSQYDVYEGFNTPSLVGIANRTGYLHHGRAETLDELLTDLHSPAKVSGTRELTPQERSDLVAYLRSL